MKNKSAGSYLPEGGTAAAAQEKAAKALAGNWVGMVTARRRADLDEVPDPLEAEDCVMSATDHLVAEEAEGVDEDVDEVEVEKTFLSSMFPPRKSREPTLDPNEAKNYTRSAAPMFRGRRCLNILRMANGGPVLA